MKKENAKVNAKVNAVEMKEILHYVINNNENLEKAGKNPVSLNIIGDPGIGK